MDEGGPSSGAAQRVFAVKLVTVSADVGPQVPWPKENRALLAALAERSLSDLKGVVPWVEQSPPTPGLSSWVDPTPGEWSLSIRDDGDDAVAAIRASLCGGAGPCRDFVAAGDRAALPRWIGELVNGMLPLLDVSASPELLEAWARPLSSDPYAVLLAGRAAASFYGWLEAKGPGAGDKRRDPIGRAILVDPSMDMPHWFEGRRAFASGEHAAAASSFARARALRPSSIHLVADHAQALLRTDDVDLAWRTWTAASERSAKDGRFVLPRLDAALMRRSFGDARAAIETLPPPLQNSAEILERQVRLADLTDRLDDLDQLLARWQQAATKNSEPVRRRIRALAADGRFADAYELTQELEKRGEREEALTLRLCCALGLRRYDLAITAAEGLGLSRVAAKIRARSLLEGKGPKEGIALIGTEEPQSLVVRGEAKAALGDTKGALLDALAALNFDPWHPEALWLAYRMERVLVPERSPQTRSRLREVDPAFLGEAEAFYGLESTAPGRTDSGAQVQAASP